MKWKFVDYEVEVCRKNIPNKMNKTKNIIQEDEQHTEYTFVFFYIREEKMKQLHCTSYNLYNPALYKL